MLHSRHVVLLLHSAQAVHVPFVQDSRTMTELRPFFGEDPLVWCCSLCFNVATAFSTDSSRSDAMVSCIFRSMLFNSSDSAANDQERRTVSAISNQIQPFPQPGSSSTIPPKGQVTIRQFSSLCFSLKAASSFSNGIKLGTYVSLHRYVDWQGLLGFGIWATVLFEQPQKSPFRSKWKESPNA